MVVCKFWEKGSCRNGDACRFEHPKPNNGSNTNRFAPLNYDSPDNARGGYNTGSRPRGRSPNSDDTYGITEKAVREDLEEAPLWILSCYGPGKRAPRQLFEGAIREQSFEEIRLRQTELAQEGKLDQALAEAQELYNNAAAQIKTALRDVPAAIRYVIEGENLHPNRLDVCKRKDGQRRNVFARAGSPSRAAGILATGAGASAQASPFAQPKPFARPLPSDMGQPSNPMNSFARPVASTSSFGQPSRPGFGQPAFGQPTQPVSAFGQPSQPTGAVNGFGQPTAPTSAFGRPSVPISSFGNLPGIASNPFAAFSNPPGSTQNTTANPFARPADAPANTTPTNPFARPADTPSANLFARSTNSPSSSPSASVNPFARPALSIAPPLNSFARPANNPSTLNQSVNPFLTRANPTAPNPFAAVNNWNATSQDPKDEDMTSPPRPTTTASHHQPSLAPVSAPTTSNPISHAKDFQRTQNAHGRLENFGGRQVTYIDETPCLRGREGQWEKIWYPNGGPSYTRPEDLPAARYTEQLVAEHRHMAVNGEFLDGKMPVLPPRREMISWNF